jgi:hypothetical protein
MSWFSYFCYRFPTAEVIETTHRGFSRILVTIPLLSRSHCCHDHFAFTILLSTMCGRCRRLMDTHFGRYFTASLSPWLITIVGQPLGRPRIYLPFCKDELPTSYVQCPSRGGMLGCYRGAEGPLCGPAVGGGLPVSTKSQGPAKHRVSTRICSSRRAVGPPGPLLAFLRTTGGGTICFRPWSDGLGSVAESPHGLQEVAQRSPQPGLKNRCCKGGGLTTSGSAEGKGNRVASNRSLQHWAALCGQCLARQKRLSTETWRGGRPGLGKRGRAGVKGGPPACLCALTENTAPGYKTYRTEKTNTQRITYM